ncbi:MAG TPA: biopolymer transporter ExbD [Steroidobacteraceae bacterium]|jgi:biopolymer transport protein ExbD|nr:biopolymer transporter ExbD [Steroidobacteraceae bacterium]
MKSKAARLVRRNHDRYHHGRDDLNIVPMIDMMVILVFFLIFTAVFSKTNILQLNLPNSSNAAPLDLPKGLKLEVIIRPDDIVVNDRNSGPLKLLANTASGYDLEHLSEFMRTVKSQFPEMSDATILSGPNTTYDTLVQVMDTVRVYQLPVAPFSKAELFPDISIGDAPT